jgi:nitroreductase
MDVNEAVRTILAVRKYRDEPVPQEVIRRIVEAGWLTGSSINKQPWHFVVVEDRERLRELGGLLRSGPYTADAGFAIVVAIERASPYGVSDASRAVQSMLLAGWSDGVGSNWVGFGGLDEVAKLLGVPDSYDVFAVLPFGYPIDPVGKGIKRRKPLGEIASRESFGNAFD